jgi:hypothetical protein
MAFVSVVSIVTPAVDRMNRERVVGEFVAFTADSQEQALEWTDTFIDMPATERPPLVQAAIQAILAVQVEGAFVVRCHTRWGGL